MKLRLLSYAAIALIFFACTNEKDKSASELEEIIEGDTEQVSDLEDESESSFIIPSAFHISSLLEQAGLDYEDDSYNKPENTSLYESRSIKLLNFGVYSTDLFFSVMKDQNDFSKKYIKSLKQISDETGMASIFNTAGVLDRFEKNIGNKDSVINLILEIQENTDMFVERSNEEHTAMLIFTGAWLEGMYLGMMSYSANEEEELGRRLFEQVCLVESVLSGLENYPEEDETINMLNLKLEQVFKTVSNTKAYRKGDYGLFEESLPKEELLKISSLLRETRDAIVKTNRL